MLDKASKILDFNLLELCLKGPESELERLDGMALSKAWPFGKNLERDGARTLVLP